MSSRFQFLRIPFKVATAATASGGVVQHGAPAHGILGQALLEGCHCEARCCAYKDRCHSQLCHLHIPPPDSQCAFWEEVEEANIFKASEHLFEVPDIDLPLQRLPNIPPACPASKGKCRLSMNTNPPPPPSWGRDFCHT